MTAACGGDRRSFLARALGGLGLVTLWRALDGLPLGVRAAFAWAQDAWPRIVGLPSEVTPVGEFYTVSKNIFDPSVDGQGWTLTVKGQVEQPYTLTLERLRQLPTVTKPHSLMCISNEVGGQLISNAIWTGVPLRLILERAGIRPGATELILRGRDGYSDSFPLSVALREGTILAHEMNGRPLEKPHGYPARVLVMGIYGMKNVKWLTELEVASHDYKGYWESRGWSDTAIYKTFSRIDVPRPRASLARGQPSWIAGVAFAGDRGVSTVEVSTDGGASWRPARVRPATGAHTWALWALPWTPTAPGRVALVVRAVDGDGALQPAGPTPPLPDGAEGFHRISVTVS